MDETIPFWSPFSWWNPNGALISMLDATAQPQWTLRCQPFHLPGAPPSSRTFGCKMSVVLTLKLSEHVVPKSSKMSPWHSWNPWWLEAKTWGSPMTYRYPLDPKGGKYTPKTDQNWSFEDGKWLAMMRCLLSCALLLFYPAETIHEACAHDCQCIFTWEDIMCFWTGYIGII